MFYNLEFCVDEEGIMFYGGILIVLFDSVFGLVNFFVVEDFELMVIIDLWVEYLGFVQLCVDILVFMECYWQMWYVVFNSGCIWFDING